MQRVDRTQKNCQVSKEGADEDDRRQKNSALYSCEKNFECILKHSFNDQSIIRRHIDATNIRWCVRAANALPAQILLKLTFQLYFLFVH